MGLYKYSLFYVWLNLLLKVKDWGEKLKWKLKFLVVVTMKHG